MGLQPLRHSMQGIEGDAALLPFKWAGRIWQTQRGLANGHDLHGPTQHLTSRACAAQVCAGWAHLQTLKPCCALGVEAHASFDLAMHLDS